MDTYIIRPWEQRYVGNHRKPKSKIRIGRMLMGAAVLALTAVVASGW